MASSAPQSLRRYVMTGAVAAITVTGALYGAGLKTRQEFKEERKETLQAPISERIEQLEAMKARYLSQRAELQSKIDRLTTDTIQPTAEKSEQSG